jgi:hypothetical protein
VFLLEKFLFTIDIEQTVVLLLSSYLFTGSYQSHLIAVCKEGNVSHLSDWFDHYPAKELEES